jgi:cell division septation protein DedD
MGNPNAAAPAAPGPAPVASAPAVRPKATEAPARATAPKAGANAPLAIVPVAQGAAPAAEPPPRSHVARTEAPSAPVATAPTSPAAAPAAGGYAVQVTSQRSEADAQTEFKSLQAKFPGQLGNRQPIIHRADLAEKGTFYRALVGPFASSEAAAAMCSNLKAAGGSCIVQKN